VFPFLYPELELRHESHELLHTISYVKAALHIVLATLFSADASSSHYTTRRMEIQGFTAYPRPSAHPQSCLGRA
jgi:hypothetical protein